MALARAEPGKHTFGHGGLGFSTHLSGEVLKSMAKIDIQQVPFRASVIPDLLSGRVTMCFCNISQVLPLIREGKLRGLAITSLTRSPQIPELPTMQEAGYAGFDVTSWFALMAPAATPKTIIDKVYRDVKQVLSQAETREQLERMGMTVIGNAPAELAAIIKRQLAERKQLIEAAGIEPQ